MNRHQTNWLGLVIATVLMAAGISQAQTVVADGSSIELTASAQSTTGQVWTLNANESKAKAPVAVYNRLLVGPGNAKTFAVLNNTQAGVAGLVLHYHSDKPIKAFTWLTRQIFVQAGPDNQDRFFVGWTTDPVTAQGKGPINPAQFKAVTALTLTGAIKKTLEYPRFSIKDINSNDVYVFIGRNDINAKGDMSNIYFNLTSSFAPEDRKNSFFRIDEVGQ
ncbi:MAG: hypothetical protein CMJ19_16330 [Phycisphaeraceae bacterium]|nr:hypothetical protein [Phycisphaeraceae bacterium]